MQINYVNVLKKFPENSINRNVFRNIAEKIIDYYEKHKNPELTLKQIGRMYSTPIYIVSKEYNQNEAGWCIVDGIIDNKYLSTLNAFGQSSCIFDIKDYKKNWIAFKYERQEYIDIVNPKLNIGDLMLDDFYYFICNDDEKSGWKKTQDITDRALKVINYDDDYEYFELGQYDKIWRVYRFYREV